MEPLFRDGRKPVGLPVWMVEIPLRHLSLRSVLTLVALFNAIPSFPIHYQGGGLSIQHRFGNSNGVSSGWYGSFDVKDTFSTKTYRHVYHIISDMGSWIHFALSPVLQSNHLRSLASSTSIRVQPHDLTSRPATLYVDFKVCDLIHGLVTTADNPLV